MKGAVREERVLVVELLGKQEHERGLCVYLSCHVRADDGHGTVVRNRTGYDVVPWPAVCILPVLGDEDQPVLCCGLEGQDVKVQKVVVKGEGRYDGGAFPPAARGEDGPAFYLLHAGRSVEARAEIERP